MNSESSSALGKGPQTIGKNGGTASKQTSFRLRSDLYRKFRATLRARKRKMNPVLQELVEDWLDRPKPPRSALVRPYLSSLPVVALVKDPRGRILFGNGEFLNLIGPQEGSLIGKVARDYVKDSKSAELIAQLDEVVRREGRPILCIEHLWFEGKLRHRMAIRFPIPPEGELELTGVLGFDMEQVEKAVHEPELKQRRICEFATEPSEKPDTLFHCLKDFLHSLPAIATVKDLNGRVLCVNDEYTRVLGKRKREVEGLLSTQIWDQSFADLVMAHDELVRRTRQTFLSVEKVPTLIGLRDRLNFRFPIFDSHNQLEMTGTLGFDYELLIEGIERLKSSRHAARAHLFLQPNDPDCLKLIYPAR